MRINPINAVNYSQSRIKNNPAFGAIFLNNATIKNTETGESKEVAIIELETEWRELLADLRLKHKKDVSEDSFQRLCEIKRLGVKKVNKDYIAAHARREMNPFDHISSYEEKKFNDMCSLGFQNELDHNPRTNWTEVQVMDDLIKESGDKIYTGDFMFMQALAGRDHHAADVNQRVQERNLRADTSGNTTSMGNYLKSMTGGKVEVMPKGGYGMMKKEYGEGVAYMPDTLDAQIWSDGYNNSASRQRILMAVEPQADGNYRNLDPLTDVYGVAEIYTDRLMDAVEDMASEGLEGKEQRMANLIADDKKYDELMKKYKDLGKPEELKQQLNELQEEIRHKYNITLADWWGLHGEKTYIYDVGDHEGRKAMEKLNFSEEKALPLKIWQLFSTDWNFRGAEEALLDAIKGKAKFRQIFTDMWTSDAINQSSDFKIIPNWNGEKLFRQGAIKFEKILGVCLK